MKRLVWNSAHRNALILSVCLISVMVLMASGLKVASSSVGSKERSVANPVGEGREWLNVQQRRELDTRYTGDRFLVDALESRAARARALASADLDRDGAPDLIAGYEWDGKGIVTVQRGNPDAFAPKDDAVFELMQKGYNPDSLIPRAQTYASPEPVDFLQVGDFNEDSQKDVLLAARGGGLYLLAGDGTGGLREPEQLTLPGQVTALAAGEFRVADGKTDVAVAVAGPLGPALLIFQEPTGPLSSAALIFPLASTGTAVQFGALDDDPFMDAAVAAGSEIEVIHGWGRAGSPKLESRAERIGLGFQARGLTIGYFIWNRAGATQIAVLGDGGAVHILQRGILNTRPFTEEEVAARARARLTQTKTAFDVESAPSWQAGGIEHWSTAREIVTDGVGQENAASHDSLVRSHFGFRGIDDVLLLRESARKLQIIRQIDPSEGAEAVALSTSGDLGMVTVDPVDAPAAVLALPQKLNGERDLVLLGTGGASPSLIPVAPTAVITVDRTDDTAAASACTGAVNDCSLRGAVQFANANPGTTISLPANTYLLTINGANGCVNEDLTTGNTIGDLEINASTTVTGAGAANTIIRQGANMSPTNDRVICMDVTLAPGFTFSFSGLTITGGRDVNSNVGGGGFIGGARNTTLNLTNVTFANNQTTGPNISGGGGVAVTGGDMNVTNCTFGAANLPGANRNDLTLGNASNSNSGGGLSYSPGDPLGVGGATGTLTVTGTTFTHNTSSSGSAGGAGIDVFNFNTSTGTANISGSTFSSNQATGTASGGGINNESLTNVNISTTSFTSNSAGNRGGGIYVGGGSLLLDGTTAGITFTGNTATTAGSSVSTASALTVSGTNTSVGGDIEVTTNGTWTNNAGSTLAPTNVVITGGTFTCNNSTMNVGGNFTIQSGAVVGGAFNGNTGTVNIAGNFSYSTGPATPTFTAGTNTFNFNGSGAQSISNSASITFNNLTDSNTTQPLTLNNSFAANGTLNVNGANAIFAPVAAAVISGSGTLAGTGTARVTRTGADAFFGQYTITNKTLTNLTVEYIGGAAQTASTTTYGGLKINNASGVTLGAGTTAVNGTLTLTSGALGVGTNTLVINNGASVGTGTLTSSATGTVNYGQGSNGQSVLAANYGNLTFSNFSKVLPSSGVIGVAGTFTTGSGVGHTITGNTFDFNGTGAQTVPALAYNNLTISGAHTTNSVTLINGGTIGILGTFTPSATFTSGNYIVTNNTVDFNSTGAQTVPAFNFNNLTISAARTTNSVTLVNGGAIRIAGAFNPSATFTSGAFVVTGNTVEYNGTSAQSLPSAFTTYNNLTLNNAAGTTGFAGLIVQGLLRVQAGTFTSSSTYKDVQIDSGATLAASAGSTINVSGAWTNNGTFTANDGTVNFNGSSAQTIAGSSTSTFNNLTINNAAGVTLSADIAINATLTLQAGALAIASRTLTLNNAISITSGSFTSNANGTVNYNQSSNGQSIAPGNYGNLTFSNFQKTLPSSGTVKIAGTFTTGAGGGHTLTGSTVEFNGASAQTLPSNFTTYNNLTLNNPAGVTGFAGLTVQGLLRVQQGTFTTSSSFRGVQIDPGATLAATAASTINVSGNWTNNGAYTANTGTVNFNGGSAQTMSGSSTTTFNNLTITNAAGVSLVANEMVNATLMLTSGALSVGTQTLTLNGAATATSGSITSSANGTINYNQGSNVQAVLAANYGNLTFSNFTKTLPSTGTVKIAGAFTTGAAGGHTLIGSTIEYNGASAQTMPAGFATYNNLTINNATGVSLGGNANVNGILALTSGDLNTGSFTLTQPNTGSSAGTTDVVGNVKRTGFVSGGSRLSFGNPFNTIQIDSGTAPTDVTVNLDKAVPTTPAPFAGAIARKYTITPNGGSGISATLRLHYLDSELNGNIEGAGLNLFRYDGANWHKEGQAANDTMDNWVEKNNVTQFSPWTMNSSVPTEARLESFRATGYDGGTFIEWDTSFEVANLGFNIYRDVGGKRVLITPQILAGSALVTGPGTPLTAGKSYAWWDNSSGSSKKTASYWLEELDLKGRSIWLGPVDTKLVGGPPPNKARAAQLAGIGRTDAPSRPVQTWATPVKIAPGISPSSFSLASQFAVKIFVNHEGWYQVKQAELLAVGLAPNTDPRNLQLYVDGQPQAISVIGESDGTLDAADAVEFYGVGMDSPQTNTRVYWLAAGATPGSRITSVPSAAPPTAGGNFPFAVERRDRTIYFSGLLNGEIENFFGAVIVSQPVNQSLTVTNMDAAASGGTLEVALQGVTFVTHQINVTLNGVPLGDLVFSGQSAGLATFGVPPGMLQQGANQATLAVSGGGGDVSLVDHLRLTYNHTFTADNDLLKLTASANQQLTIGGFSANSIRVFDITNPAAVQEAIGQVQQQGASYSVSLFVPGTGQRTLLALTGGQTGPAKQVAANLPSSWNKTSRGADFLIITPRDFFSAVEPLRVTRQSQGLAVAIVDIEDIYDEYSFGQKTPQAIKDFLAFAGNSWKKKARYAVFVGDACYDPKNYLGFGEFDLVPTKLIDTIFMEASSDDWLADFNGDGIPELSVGRLPVRKGEEAEMLIAKIIGYDESRPPDEMLLVADANDGYDFEAASAQLHPLVPGDARAVDLNRGQMGTTAAKVALLDAIARGQRYVNYTGHGNVNQWHANLLTNEDAAALDNADHLPVFLMMTCLNGYFNDPALDSIAEKLLLNPKGGAVAVWTSTGQTLPAGQWAINQEMYFQMFSAPQVRLGDAARAAKLATTDIDVRQTWILFGDPTMRLR